MYFRAFLFAKSLNTFSRKMTLTTPFSIDAGAFTQADQ